MNYLTYLFYLVKRIGYIVNCVHTVFIKYDEAIDLYSFIMFKL